MAADVSVPLWERPLLRSAAGKTLRPGGFSLTDRAAEFIGMVPGWHVLDVGCGLGASVQRFRSRFGARAWGVEPSAGQLEQAGNRAGLVRAWGDRLPFCDNVFDALFCECVLSLFDDQPGGLGEFHRVLGPGGFLVLSDLYALNSQSPDLHTLESPSCASRAISLEQTLNMVEAGGFELRLLEDHSPYLKELAGKLIFAGDAAPAVNIQANFQTPTQASPDICSCGGRGRGYYLMIAQKQGGASV